MPQVIITITPDGQSKVEAKGVSGPTCKDLTRSIERALGKTTADQNTAEFHRHASIAKSQELKQA